MTIDTSYNSTDSSCLQLKPPKRRQRVGVEKALLLPPHIAWPLLRVDVCCRWRYAHRHKGLPKGGAGVQAALQQLGDVLSHKARGGVQGGCLGSLQHGAALLLGLRHQQQVIEAAGEAVHLQVERQQPGQRADEAACHRIAVQILQQHASLQLVAEAAPLSLLLARLACICCNAIKRLQRARETPGRGSHTWTACTRPNLPKTALSRMPLTSSPLWTTIWPSLLSGKVRVSLSPLRFLSTVPPLLQCFPGTLASALTVSGGIPLVKCASTVVMTYKHEGQACVCP